MPQVGTQEPQSDFKGEWKPCTPQSATAFSAVGYFFGRTLHRSLNVPVGLINNAWGGSAAEAWVRRDRLQADPTNQAYLDQWKKTEAIDFETRMARHKKAVEEARQAGKKAPRAPRNPLTGQHRPANLYNGMLHPVIGYGMRGCIWYQGENNARGERAAGYSKALPAAHQQLA